MTTLSDQNFLLNDQYRDSSNLDARIVLHRRFSSNQTGWFRWTVDQWRIPPVARVLDIGCGPAALWCDQLARVPRGWKITLADLSPGMIDRARANLAAAGAADDRRFDLRTADVQLLPFRDNLFDAVLANHMLYHVPDIARALAEIRRVLKPGGQLVAATNGEGHMRELHDLTAPFASHEPAPPAPEQRFGLENGAQQLAPWFARVERRDYPDSLEVDEAAPLAAYVLSTRTMRWSAAGEPSFGTLTSHFESLLARDGVIHISKASGLLIAVKLPTPSLAEGDAVTLREVVVGDLPVFFEQQLDWEAQRAAAFTGLRPADRSAFGDHWSQLLTDQSATVRTILFGGQIAGYIACRRAFGAPEVSGWLGREFWGRGIATRALAGFLSLVEERPLTAAIARDNLASLRVLQKSGFVVIREDLNWSPVRDDLVDELVLALDAAPSEGRA